MHIPRKAGFAMPKIGRARYRSALTTALAAALFVATAHTAEAANSLTPSPAPSPSTKTQPITERPDRVSAALTARLQGSRVLIADETTESTLIYANPDGTTTLEAASAPVRVKQGGKWTPIDTTLTAADGVLRPKAGLATIAFSAGGQDKPLVMLESTDKKQAYELAWPTSLPQPRIEGNKATYTDAAGPGADLVLTALPAGFRHDVVLRVRPAGPVEYRFPVRTRGLKLGKTENGGLELTDAKGRIIGSAPTPIMYDSTTPAAAPAQGRPETNRAAIDTKVEAEGDTQVLVLKPDTEFLAAPTTNYPVTVDPTITLDAQSTTTITSPCPNGDENASPYATIGVTQWECPDDWYEPVMQRAVIGFNTSSLAGQQITDAKLELLGDLSTCPANQRLLVQRITGAWSANNVFWSDQPAVTTAGQATVTPPTVCTPTSTPENVPWSIPITDIARAWADGAAGRGLMLKASPGSKTGPQFSWYFYPGDDTPLRLVVTAGSSPSVGQVRTQPATAANDHTYTNTLTPTLVAETRDPDGGYVRADYEVEHDPATTEQGSGQIWAGSIDGVVAGTDAKITVPAGKLSDGWKLRWRARVADAQSASAWSQWQPLIVDATAPKVTSIRCYTFEGGITADSWQAPLPDHDEIKCSAYTDDGDFSLPGSDTTDATELWWGFDDPDALTKATGNWGWISDGQGGVKALEFTIPKLGPGWHTIYAKVRDKAHNLSPFGTFSFGITPGGLVTAAQQQRSQRFVTLDAAAAPSITGVTYRYRTIPLDSAWIGIPAGDVTAPGTGQPIADWPQTRSDTGKNFSPLVWDAFKTLKAAGEQDNIVDIQACFESTADPWDCSDPVTVTLDQSAFGGSYATEEVGPGELALHSGDFSVEASDASVFGIGVTRTHTTLTPDANRFDSFLDGGILGPGWHAGFPSAPSMVAEFSPSGTGEAGRLQLVAPDGTTLSYIREGDTFEGVGDAADGSRLTTTDEELTVTESNGNKTIYVKYFGIWVVARTETPAAESAVTYLRDAQGRVNRIVAAAPVGVTCGTTLVAGCRALDMTYATTTTATGVASGWGDVKNQLKSVSFTAFDPETNAMKTTVMASYLYDSTKRLRQVTDPRSNLDTLYYYNGQGRLSQITPPGLAPWRLEYDTKGRLAHVQREGGDNDPTWAVAYDVPTGGAGAPIDLTAAQTGTWGQLTDLPVTGSALFPASHVPARGPDGAYAPATGDWPYAGLVYTDVDGRAVNDASYGAGAWQVGAAEYDDKGNLVWELTPGNRAQALVPNADTDPYVAGRVGSAERADLLAMVSTYNADSDLLVREAPAHPAKMASGQVASARERITYVYDEDKPSGTNYHLVTSIRSEPVVLDGTAEPGEQDHRVARNAYDPVRSGDISGWELRKATVRTVVMGGQDDLERKTRYSPAGQVIEERLPESDGADPGTKIHTYYTADGSGPAECRKPQWAGLLCRTAPQAQPGSGNPLAVQFTESYDLYGQPAKRTETAGSVTRTVTIRYDAAGRVIGNATVATPADEGGVPVPETITTYEPATGLVSTRTAGARSTVTEYDDFGRAVSYTDADGNTSTAAFNIDGDAISGSDGKGTFTFTYGGTDAVGKTERRRVLTRIEVPGVGAFTGAYGSNGELLTQTYPGGLTATWRYDNLGNDTALSYGKNGETWLSFTNTMGLHQAVAAATSPLSGQDYGYDRAGRLTTVADTYAGECVTRSYEFTPNTNRNRLTTYDPGDGGTCSTNGASTEVSYTYDDADRLTTTGYTYDAFGRTITIPAAHAAGGTDLQVGYHVNDLVASLQQDGTSRTYALDPEGRIRSTSQVGGARPGTTINHYAGMGDQPAWIAESDGSWTRNIEDLSGNLAAIQHSGGQVKHQLTNLHGDVVANVDAAPTATGIESYSEQTETGLTRNENTTDPGRYGWLGGKQRAAEPLGAVVLMGARLYNPTTARFLQVDPVAGGSANAYDYCLGDPINCLDLDGRIALIPVLIPVLIGVGFLVEVFIAAVIITAIVAGVYGIWDNVQWMIANAETERAEKATPANSPYWKSLKPHKGKTKTNGKSGKAKEYYEWDYTHGDIEVYDGRGRHKGSADPVEGKIYKPPTTHRIEP